MNFHILLASLKQQCSHAYEEAQTALWLRAQKRIKIDYQGEFNMPIPVRVVNDFVLAIGTPAIQSKGPMVEALANGRFLVGYQAAFTADSDISVLGYWATPTSAINDLVLGTNGSTSFNDGQVSLSSYSDGSFVMAFQRVANPVAGDGGDIYLRFFGSTGSTISNEIAVSAVAGEQSRPEVQVFENGNVLVTWIDEGTSRVRYAIYNQTGTLLVTPTDLSAFAINQDFIDLRLGTTLLDNGNVVISYYEPFGVTDFNLRFSIASSNGAILANALDTDLRGATEVSALTDGRFIVFGRNSFQIFNADGTSPSTAIAFPTVLFALTAVSLLDGRILVVGETNNNIGGAIYRPDGTIDGGFFTIADNADNLERPSVDVLADGRFIVSWQSSASNGSVVASIWDPRETGVTINGTSGDDTYVGSNFADTMVLGGGNDSVWGGSGSDVIFGNAGSDTLRGDAGDDVLNGGAGADTLEGGSGTDTASYANAGIGIYYLAGDIANATGEARGDTYNSIENVMGSNFNDAIGIGGGNNTLSGMAGNDQLFGQGGDDVLIGGLGGDILNGDSGIDIASYENATTAIYVVFADLGGSGGEAAGDSFISIEGLRGSIYNDILGMDGTANFIFGGIGDDKMFGEGGNDVLDGGLGADLFNGGSGTDTASYQSAYTGDIYLLAGDFGNAYGDGRGDSYVSIENIIGSSFRDIIGIGEGDNKVEGRGGNDWLWGQGGNDILVGGTGGDLLDGGTGNDTASYEDAFPQEATISGIYLFFGDLGSATGEAAGDSFLSIENITGTAYDDIIGWDSGNNVINGGAGNDRLFGGAGNDTLIGGAGNDRYAYTGAGFGNDIITNFEDGADRIDFSSYAGASFANLLITAATGGVSVTFGTDTIFLGGVALGQISAADFLF
jgi:Ca2+-binding RTX toxin-like protein